ncbi:uncharacterized protein LOC130636102 isoform X2 [Hydractinia symbiolongicarpus]|uniref:uncharacterized protein LOC130636102 isoform X2 n=1 Tax=Hydractinia symbiolongicarpus TaxID=13093 RepID=UPI00254C41D1|nr:uncharacterized protein LOC130636102 isoform X2 [Hydractinia symbiolongicarpus]
MQWRFCRRREIGIYSELHEQYKKGGNNRKSLGVATFEVLVSQKRIGSIIKIMSSTYTTHIDYVTKVLIKEAVILMYAKVKKITRSEAFQILLAYLEKLEKRDLEEIDDSATTFKEMVLNSCKKRQRFFDKQNGIAR